jgi:hypothetical protein
MQAVLLTVLAINKQGVMMRPSINNLTPVYFKMRGEVQAFFWWDRQKTGLTPPGAVPGGLKGKSD